MQLLDKISGNEAAACRVTTNVTLAVTSAGTNVLLSWNTELFDTDNMHDNVTNPSRITIRTAGVYVVNLSVEWTPVNPTGVRTIFLAINGGFSNIPAWDGRPAEVAAGGPTRHGVTTIYQFAVNDYIEAYASQGSGAALSINNGTISAFSAARI